MIWSYVGVKTRRKVCSPNTTRLNVTNLSEFFETTQTHTIHALHNLHFKVLGSTGAGPVGFVVPPGDVGLTDDGEVDDGMGVAAAINNDNNNNNLEITARSKESPNLQRKVV